MFQTCILLVVVVVGLARSATIDRNSLNNLEDSIGPGGRTIRFGRVPPRRPIFVKDWPRFDKHPNYDDFLA